MPDMDRRLGPWRLRAWGLALNFVGNAVALFGMVRLLDGGSARMLASGIAVSGACLAALAIPPRPDADGA